MFILVINVFMTVPVRSLYVLYEQCDVLEKIRKDKKKKIRRGCASRLSLRFMLLYMHTQVGCVCPPCCFYTCAIKLCCWISFIPIGVH